MKRIVLWLMSTISAVVLLFGYHTSTSGALTANQGLTPLTTSTNGGAAGASSSTGSGNSGSGGSAGPGGNDGGTSAGASASPQAVTATTVTGDTVNTQWGPVQVELTVKAGTITDVAVPVYPNGNGTDAQINSYALPILMQETVDAQNANIQMISGATVTSTGYVQSLQSALDKASL